jgi:hypothetical protein
MNRRIAPLVVLVLALVLAPLALARGGGDSSSLSLVLLNSSDGVPHYGQSVTFNVSTTATDRPQVGVTCLQGGDLVYSASAGFWPGYPWPWEQTFVLRSNMWTGGAADCSAKLYYWNGRRNVTLKTLSFHVYE